MLQDLNAPTYRDPVTGRHLAPWTLRVLSVRFQAIGFNDWRRGIMGYYDLAREARFEARRTHDDARTLWEARLEDIGIRIANALIEMGDFESACRFLRSLPVSSNSSSMQRLGLVYLQIGNVKCAKRCMDAATPGDQESGQHLVFEALCNMAKGEFGSALEKLSFMPPTAGENLNSLAGHNRAACLVYLGRMQEARSSLENMVENDSLFGDSLFNLATLFDLCTNDSTQLKAALATRTAQHKPKQSRVWERSNIDFKM